MDFWLLEIEVKQRILEAIARGATPTADQQAEIEARGRNDQGILTVAGSEAQINVIGTLTKNFNWIAAYFGGGNTTYSDITSALASADADPIVKKITMNFDSPGGNVAGLFEAADAIKATKKPVTAVVDGMAMSAAYALASQADKILAAGKSSMVGSLGVAVSYTVRDDVVEIASTNAPNKRPDLKTAKGKAVIRAELDGIHELFASIVAEGRGTSVENVNSSYGLGGMVLATPAIEAGMIDGFLLSDVPVKPGKTAVNNNVIMEHKVMNLTELKAQYPGLYAELLSIGVAQGASQEKERCSAHLLMGAAHKAMPIAIEAIEAGAGLTDLYTAKYLTAGKKAADVETRVADNQTVDPGVPAAAGPDEEDKVCLAVAEMLGGGDDEV